VQLAKFKDVLTKKRDRVGSQGGRNIVPLIKEGQEVGVQGNLSGTEGGKSESFGKTAKLA